MTDPNCNCKDDLNVQVYASLTRALEQAPIGTFADACRIADRQHRERIKTREERRQPQLAESTEQALDFLLNVNDADRLNRFIAEHPRTEARLILAYVKERRS
jgi:hypothetical protein